MSSISKMERGRLSIQCPRMGDFLMNIGEKVIVSGKEGIIIDTSKRWDLALYYIQFSDGRKEWVRDFDNRGNEQEYGSFRFAKACEKVNFT